jgi:1,4-alpha-glucan branching enzyme
LPASVGADAVWLVGDFNDWSRTAHPMRRDGDAFLLTLELEPGRTYRYRYLLDGIRWENDWAAEEYAPNPYGSEDSLVTT